MYRMFENVKICQVLFIPTEFLESEVISQTHTNYTYPIWFSMKAAKVGPTLAPKGHELKLGLQHRMPSIQALS